MVNNWLYAAAIRMRSPCDETELDAMPDISKYLILLCIPVLLWPAGPARAQSAFEDPSARVGETGGGIAPVSPTVEGDVSQGASSQVVILFKNENSQPLKALDVSLYPSSNVTASVGENECAGAPLEPGAVCAMAITVQGMQPGRYRIEILVRHNGRARISTATITGNVDVSTDTAGGKDIEATPNDIDFQNLSESRTLLRSIVLRNATARPITIDSVSIEGGESSGFTVKSDCAELKTGESCFAGVSWAPQQPGPAEAALVVRHNGAQAITTVPLKGVYQPETPTAASVFPSAVPGKGLLTASMDSVDFGNISAKSSMTVSLVNVGDAPVKLTGITLSDVENGIKIDKGGCRTGAVLEPVEACPLTLIWEPVRAGEIRDDVRIAHNGARGILVLPLRGTAEQAVNRDSGTLVIGNDGGDFSNIPPISARDLIGDGESAAPPPVPSSVVSTGDIRGRLDGYSITSLGAARAVISGPGGSRVVRSGEQTVLGGTLWYVNVQPSAVEFDNNGQKVMLLFDKSLNPGGTSGSSSATGGSETSGTTGGVN